MSARRPGSRKRRPASTSRSRTPTWSPPWRRGLPVSPPEDPVAPGAGAPQAIGSVLEGLFGAAGPWRAGMASGELARRWVEVVGAALAAETSPDALDGAGVLTVKASSAPWATQLRFLAGAIASNANEVLGRAAVTKVRVIVDPRVRP